MWKFWICFPLQLYQISGFTLPMCLKCSEQFTSKGITINSLNFYQNLHHQPLTATITTQINNSSAPTTAQLNSSSTNQPTNLSRANDMNTDSNQSSISSHDQPINIKQEALGLAEELEKSLQNGDVCLLCQCVRNKIELQINSLKTFRVNYKERKGLVDFVPRHFQGNHLFFLIWEIIQ